jgi:hypothetical protein
MRKGTIASVRRRPFFFFARGGGVVGVSGKSVTFAPIYRSVRLTKNEQAENIFIERANG